MVYKFKPGSYINADAQIAGEMCETLAKTCGLTAKNLLNANRDKSAPLHNAFEWNDKVAAEEFRIGQARHIIACIVVCREDGKPPVREFYHIDRTENEYHPIETIIKHQDMTAKLRESALRELIQFKEKYAKVCELADVFTAIDEYQEKINGVI